MDTTRAGATIRPAGEPGHPLVAGVDAMLRARGSALDAPQGAALARLARLSDALGTAEAARRLPWRWFRPAPPLRGIYLCGRVGSGKTMLMDAFHARLPVRRRARVHFHAFMRDIHRELATLAREVDPLAAVAKRFARRTRVLCCDEFHVADIADAMILARLFDALSAAGVILVTTSNDRPEELYADGLHRDRFVPAIARIRDAQEVIEIDGGVDYRLRALTRDATYHAQDAAAAEAALAAAFERMRNGPDEDPRLAIEARTIRAHRVAGSAAWFDFATLCEGPRSPRDYLELARRFPVLVLSGVPRFPAAATDPARRFTWLVDILYDHRVKLLVSAAAAPAELCTAGPNAREFLRTASRLTEMQTRDYLARPHDPGASEIPPEPPVASL